MIEVPNLTALRDATKAVHGNDEHQVIDTVFAIVTFALDRLDRITVALEDIAAERKAG